MALMLYYLRRLPIYLLQLPLRLINLILILSAPILFGLLILITILTPLLIIL